MDNVENLEDKRKNNGGARKGSGRKKLPTSQKKEQIYFYLTPDKAKIVREFVEKLENK